MTKLLTWVQNIRIAYDAGGVILSGGIMRSTLFITLALVLFAALPIGAETLVGKVYKIEADGTVIVSGASAGKAAIGDRFSVDCGNGVKVELVVTFPMMTIAKCKIAATDVSRKSKIALGQSVYVKGGSAPSLDGAVPQKLAGRWKEFWAPGQETNVTYHDEYRITLTGNDIKLEIAKGEQYPIESVLYTDGKFSFTQKTSFDVKYTLTLSSDGSKLEGEAVTPEGQYPIRWERIPEPVAGAIPDALAGRWKEFWAPGQETDVTYHDEYRITINDGEIEMEIVKGETAPLLNVTYANKKFTFTQKTAFDVKYTLTLSADGTRLNGEAVTPNGKYPIRWEKIPDVGDDARSLSIGHWKEYWAYGQETDVNYNDEYTVYDQDGTIHVRLDKESDESNMSGVDFTDGELIFTQTTSFDVNYRLKPSADGKLLEGTATTPENTYPIRWERID